MPPNVTNVPLSYSKCGAFSDEDIFNLIVNGVLLNGVGAMGIVGNVISMIILSRPEMKLSINYLLIKLVECDTVLIISSVLLFGLKGIYKNTKSELFHFLYNNFYPYIFKVIYPVALTTQTMSVYLTLTVTLERYFAVCRPLQARSLCTHGKARLYALLIVIFSILYNLPRFWEFNVQEFRDHKNCTILIAWPAALRHNEIYVTVYLDWLYMVFMNIIPFSCLAVLNTAIYRQIQQANRDRRRLCRLQQKDIGLATMLLPLVVVFMLCYFLPLVLSIMKAYYHMKFFTLPLTKTMIEVSNLLVTVNSSLNFVIYVTFGEKFKCLFLKMFCSRGS